MHAGQEMTSRVRAKWVRRIDKGFFVGWLLWGALFLVWEVYALTRRERGDTLSEHVWWLLDRPWGVDVFGLFWGWLTAHFWFGGLIRRINRSRNEE